MMEQADMQRIVDMVRAQQPPPTESWQGLNAWASHNSTDRFDRFDRFDKGFPQRARDPFSWMWIPSTQQIEITNVRVMRHGVVTEGDNYAGGVNGTVWIYATVAFDPTTYVISTVSVASASSLAGAQSSEEDIAAGTMKLPLYKATYADGKFTMNIDYIHHGALVEVGGEETWTTDTNREALEAFDQFSIEYVVVDGGGTDTDGYAYKRYLQLYNFEVANDAAMLTADDAGWTDATTGKTSQRILVRKVTAEGQYRLHYKMHNPMPTGSNTHITPIWDDTKGGWVKAEAVNKPEASGTLAFGDTVVTDVEQDTTGKLIKVTRSALPAAGIPDGYEEETLNVVTDGKIVTRTVLVKTATKSDVATWDSYDSRLLLQVNTSGVLRLDKGYLKA